jgi:hypothetical protein
MVDGDVKPASIAGFSSASRLAPRYASSYEQIERALERMDRFVQRRR